jgi:hypothetical protein
MNLKIKDGFVWINERKVCDALPDILRDCGMNISSINVLANHLDKKPAPADPWVNPIRVATLGDVEGRINKLLESLAKRFETMDPHTPCLQRMAHELRAEKENWK